MSKRAYLLSGSAFTAAVALGLAGPAAAQESEVEEVVVTGSFIAQMRAIGWGVLAETAGREIVMGAITQPWQADVTFVPLDPAEFAAFREPGYVKIVWNLRVDPDGPDRAIFHTETRAIATDATARARFRNYWAFVSPGVWLIRRISLGLVKRDAEGFLTQPEQWTEDLAAEIARDAGIDPLTDRHLQVVHFMRDTYLTTGTAPTIRTLGKASGVPVKELYQLFPKGPAKLAAKIAGIPKPRGCI